MSGNQLSGEIPASLGNLTQLERLSIGANQFSGGLPPEMAGMTSLENLSVGNAGLSGPLPTWLPSLPSLQEVRLSGNAFTGSIPAAYGSFQNGFWGLHLSDNQLTGPVPAALAQNANIESLHFSGNDLSGQLPIEIAAIGEALFTCSWDGNPTLFMPDLPEYRVHDTNGDGAICALPFASAEDVGEDAIDEIPELVPDPLNEGLANALISKLENAIAKAEAGQYKAAINQMMSFINQLEDMVASGVVTQEEADPFLDQANAMIAIWEMML